MPINFIETKMPLPNNENCGEYKDRKLRHICEVCSKEETLTPEEGYKKGWDYAPYMYPFKVLSPRTCNKCGMENTAYWAVAANNKTFNELTDIQKKTIKRIHCEPESIIVKNNHEEEVKDDEKNKY